MKVLVYGFYGKNNLGDNLFIEAFRYLFPNLELMFTDTISLAKLRHIDAVFFGGGSFLFGAPLMSEDALEEVKLKKIFYLGVGVETEIHPVHIDLMRRAIMIVTRSPEQIDKLRLLNKNVSTAPDLVYALQPLTKLSIKSHHSVLIMPNINVVPCNSDPHWKHASWGHFKSEFAQFLDWLVENEYHPTLFPMCQSPKENDAWVSAELMGHMVNRNEKYLYTYTGNLNISQLTELVSKYSIVITQRFHGIVLSEMTRTPYIALYHHDKLKFSRPNEGTFLSYYNSSKQSFIDAFQKTIKMKFVQPLPIETATYETFSKEVIDLL